jgi:hypothetical protein
MGGVGVFFGTPSHFINLTSWPQSNFQIGFLKSQGFWEIRISTDLGRQKQCERINNKPST